MYTPLKSFRRTQTVVDLSREELERVGIDTGCYLAGAEAAKWGYFRAATLLALVPDAIIQSVATRCEINMGDEQACLCAWLVREAFELLGKELDPDFDLGTKATWQNCQRLFGGTTDDWEWLFHGVTRDTTDLLLIETAFLNRLAVIS